MPSVYETEAFQQRVNYAAQCLVGPYSRCQTRHFDTCFEMYDGNAVVCALYRRALKNPRLWAALEQRAPSMIENGRAYSDEYAGRKLPDVAREQRETAKARFTAWLAEQDARQSA